MANLQALSADSAYPNTSRSIGGSAASVLEHVSY